MNTSGPHVRGREPSAARASGRKQSPRRNDDWHDFVDTIRRLGARMTTGFVISMLALFSTLIAAFAFWDQLERLPGVGPTISAMAPMRGIPKANGDRFTILLAVIDNDSGGDHQRLIRTTLADKLDHHDIDVLLTTRSIRVNGSGTPEQALAQAHERVREMLRKSNASAMIWGEALDANTNGLMRLHWTTNHQADLRRTATAGRLTDTQLDLPTLHGRDLRSALGLLGLAQSALYVPHLRMQMTEQLETLIPIVRFLAASDTMSTPQGSSLRLALADALTLYGQSRGDLESLDEAIGIYRSGATEALRSQAPRQWAALHNRLGLALRAANDLNGQGGATTAAALDAFQQAERGLSEAPMTADTAQVQINLAQTLRTLGERDNDAKHLTAAAQILQETQALVTRDKNALGWAMLQAERAHVLMLQGTRESGTGKLHEAVQLLRDAQLERSRKRSPQEWAAAQARLGTMLRQIGEREDNPTLLEEAANDFRDALSETSRDREPLVWADHMTALGDVLVRISERQDSTALLEEAATVFRGALTVRSRTRYPTEWAELKNHLGVALAATGQREKGNSKLEEALVAHNDALKEFTRDRLPRQWSRTHSLIGGVYQVLGERERGTAKLEKAVQAYREALAESRADPSAAERSALARNLALATDLLSARSRANPSWNFESQTTGAVAQAQ